MTANSRNRSQTRDVPAKISRRGFLAGSTAALAVGMWTRRADAVQPRYPWPVEEGDYRDPDTGAYVRMLTPGIPQAEVIYQTHPMWVKGMHYFIFYAIESGERLPRVRQMGSGIVRPLTDTCVGANFVDSGSGDYLFFQGRTLFRQPVESTFQRYRAAEKMTELPPFIEKISGGIFLDADGKTLQMGARLTEEGTWGIVSLGLRSNNWHVRCRTDFQVGHVQAHPRVPDLIMFCHETGGDAPQRMWRVMPGVAEAVPTYREQEEEWVTHEVWWNNRALFTIWPQVEERLKYRHGIVSVDLQGGDLREHASYKAWHTHGSPDGRWLLGDDMDRNLWLIAPYGEKRRLLAGGLRGEGFTTHPHASFSPDSRAVVSGSSRAGREAVVLVESPGWDALAAD